MEKDLYRHAEFLRGIARGLLREVHAADDVVHDAYASVLARGGVFSRAYLAATVRHKAFRWLRSRKRATQREREAARPESAPPSGDQADLAGQAELQRKVAAAVADLDPLYRDALILRYYQGLEPRAIAHRTGQPIGTVKTRLRRGLQMLRARLDAEHGGDSRRWALGLAGALLTHAPEAAAAVAGVPVGLKLAAAVVAAGGITLVAWSELRKPPPEPPRHVVATIRTASGGVEPIEPEGTPQDPTRQPEETGSGPPSTLRWEIKPGTHRGPEPGTELRLLWDKPTRPPIVGPHARVEEDTVVVDGMREESGNAFAITPDGSVAWLRWNRRAKGWVNEVTFYPPRTVKVRVIERGGWPLAGAPVLVKQGYTPRGNARTDVNGEVIFEQLFGQTLDAFLGRDEELGTYWRWLGSVDLNRSDGDIVARVEPLEPFMIMVSDGRFLEPSPGVDLYRAEAVGLSVDRKAGCIAFRARRLEQGHPLRATVRLDGFQPVTLSIEGNEALCEVPLAATVTGTVILPRDGTVRLGISRVREDGRSQFQQVGLSRHSDGEPASFEVSGLTPGEYLVYDDPSGRMLGPFVLRANERRELAPFDLSRCVWVEGRVEPGPPASGLDFVRARFADERGMLRERRPREGQVRGEGRFKLRLPGDREATLVLESQTRIASPVRVGGAGKGIVIRAREGARAVFELALPDEPKGPRRQATARLRQGERALYRLIEIDRERGRGAIVGLSPGRYDTVNLRIGSRRTTVLSNVTIRPGTNHLGRLEFARGSRVNVHIRVPEGQGPPRLNLHAISCEDPQDTRWVNPAATEVVVLPGLGPGRWKLSVHVMPSIPERFGFQREIEVDGETDLNLELDLRP